MPTATFFRQLLPAVLLLGSLTLASCEGCKDHDPRPHAKCGSKVPATTTPPASGNS